MTWLGMNEVELKSFRYTTLAWMCFVASLFSFIDSSESFFLGFGTCYFYMESKRVEDKITVIKVCFVLFYLVLIMVLTLEAFRSLR